MMQDHKKKGVLSPGSIREFPKWKHMDAARKASILYPAKKVKKFLLDPTPGSEFNPAYAILRGGLV